MGSPDEGEEGSGAEGEDSPLARSLAALGRGDSEALAALRKHAGDVDAEGLLETLNQLQKTPEAAWIVAAFAAHSTTLAQAAREAARLVRMACGESPASAGVRYAAIVWVLGRETSPEASDSRAPGVLEAELQRHLLVLGEELGPAAEESPEADGPPLEQGILAWDERFARHVEGIGESGEERARDVRKHAAQRLLTYQRGEAKPIELMRLWFPPEEVPAPRFVAALAVTLWRDVLLPRFRKPAALVHPVLDSVLDFHARDRAFDESTGQLSFRNREVASLAHASGASLDLDLLRGGLSLLGSVTAHKVLRWEVFSGHERAIRHEPYFHILEVVGGWAALAEQLDLNPKKHVHDLRSVVYTQAHFAFVFPDGSRGNMLSYTEKGAQGRNERALVTISLGAPLLPDYAIYLASKTGKASSLIRQGQRLVPMTRELPPRIGRPNEHGQQITLSLATMAELRERAAELAKDGAARISHDRFTRLADRSSLPRRLLVPLLDRWINDGDDGPAFLRRVGPDRYTLADAYGAERAFLLEAGQRELDGVKAGAKSSRSRKATLRRRGGRRP